MFIILNKKKVELSKFRLILKSFYIGFLFVYLKTDLGPVSLIKHARVSIKEGVSVCQRENEGVCVRERENEGV